VIGSGPAGLTAARRLNQAGHRVEVLEALGHVGGRTHAERFGPGHHCDTGAGWLATFYTRTLAMLDELGCRDMLLPRRIRGASQLIARGEVHQQPFTAAEIAASPLLSDDEKRRMADYLAQLAAEQPPDLSADLAYDSHSAADEFAQIGPGVVEYVVRPLFEGPFFSRLAQHSAAMERAWLGALRDFTFFQLSEGMDAPWLRLSESLDVRTGERVDAVRPAGGGVELDVGGAARRYDGVVLAVPAPAAARMLEGAPGAAPGWLGEVRYAPHVRLYAARRDAADADFGVRSAELLERPAAEVAGALWEAGRQFAPGLFPLEQADVTHLIRWEWAVPIMGVGHYRRLAAYARRPPIVLAGDWAYQACVEGAVRSGEAAAEAFGAA
jgi:oxygen-dependent protoporphyrinogen oxidase